MKTSETIVDLIGHFTDFQSELQPAPFDSKNPHFKNDYASYASIIETIRPLLAKYHLSFFHGSYVENGQVILVTRLNHKSGQWVESYYPINPVKNDPQGFGSALTYAKRYTLSALLGVVSDVDDDANIATGLTKQTITQAPKQEIQNMAPKAKVDVTPLATQPSSAVTNNEQSPPVGRWSKAVQQQASVNHDPVGDYTPTFGKFKGIKLRDVTVHDLNNYIVYLQTSAANENKPISKNAAEFISEANKFLKTRVPKKQNGPSDFEIEQAFMNEQVPF